MRLKYIVSANVYYMIMYKNKIILKDNIKLSISLFFSIFLLILALRIYINLNALYVTENPFYISTY